LKRLVIVSQSPEFKGKAMNQAEREQRRAQWLGHVSSWEGSGQSRAEYCAAHGLKRDTFNDWVVRVRKHHAQPAELPNLNWVPVTVQAEEASPGFVLRGASRWQLSLPTTVCPQWLAKLLRELT
jgi:hypothetical protein